MVSHPSMLQLSSTPSLDSEPQQDMMTVLTSELWGKKNPTEYAGICLPEAALLAC